jgi:predicted pyridoxine 5'-phosphate oxidase superfamily flavin-nucleotide-binding protein
MLFPPMRSFNVKPSRNSFERHATPVPMPPFGGAFGFALPGKSTHQINSSKHDYRSVPVWKKEEAESLRPRSLFLPIDY